MSAQPVLITEAHLRLSRSQLNMLSTALTQFVDNHPSDDEDTDGLVEHEFELAEALLEHINLALVQGV